MPMDRSHCISRSRATAVFMQCLGVWGASFQKPLLLYQSMRLTPLDCA